ncbi:hypothetical protein EDD17DRAFT_1016342 [Pisolithus thermaeus]|nr:hypothetical protein EDD17DRAFT_1016342 [Pisolithus thermaeus]
MTTVELTDKDATPLHQQRFPLTFPLPPQSKVDVNPPTCASADADGVTKDGGTEGYATVTTPNRQEHKIRNLNLTMGRFITTHHLPLQQPPPRLRAVDGDLYIHHYGNKKVQIWLKEGDQWVGDISDGHHHPLLQDYRLFVADDIEPTWVTKKTRSTYKGRIRGHQKSVN